MKDWLPLIGVALGAALTFVGTAIAVRKRNIFDVKLAACLEALSVVDAVYAKQTWTVGSRTIKPLGQPLDIEAARRAHNHLALTCKRPDVVTLFAKTIGLHAAGSQGTALNPADIIPLRNAMRRELGFGRKPLAGVDRDVAWIAQL